MLLISRWLYSRGARVIMQLKSMSDHRMPEVDVSWKIALEPLRQAQLCSSCLPPALTIRWSRHQVNGQKHQVAVETSMMYTSSSLTCLSEAGGVNWCPIGKSLFALLSRSFYFTPNQPE